MDEFDDSVATVEESARGGKPNLIPVLIGLAGIVIGVTGIVMANQAQKQVRTLQARMALQVDKTPELQKSVADVNDRLEKLGTEFVRLGRVDNQIQTNTQAAFNEVSKSVAANREALNELATRLTEVVDRLGTGRASASAATAGGSGGTAAPAVAAEPVPEEGVYLVQSGDTLSSIAKRFGLTLTRLQSANPAVNPRALQIGQRITIPQP